MKTRLASKTKQAASSLLIALVITSILSVAVMGYLTVVEQQNFLSARSQTWNIAIAVAEAGVEEAVEKLNVKPMNLGTDGWTGSGGVYTRERVLPDGSSYTATIVPTPGDPDKATIYSRAIVNPPSFVRNRLSTFFAAGGVGSPDPTIVRRSVRVGAARNSLYRAVLVAKRSIDLKGNGTFTDSYDSTDWFKSLYGRYSLTRYSGDKGDVATNGGILNESSMTVGNANIYGIIHTGPGCPVDLGVNGGVGPHGSQTADIPTAIRNGYVLQDANFTYPETGLPADYTTYLTPAEGDVAVYTNQIISWTTNTTGYPESTSWSGVVTNVSGTNVLGYYPNPAPWGITTNWHKEFVTKTTYPLPGTYEGVVTAYGNAGSYYYKYWQRMYVISYNVPIVSSYTYSAYATNTLCFTNHYDNVLYSNTKYQTASLTGSTLVVGPNVTLVLPNGLTGDEHLTFNTGASLFIRAGGTSVKINGDQYDNPNTSPSSFMIWCSPSVTTFTLNGNASFTGIIVAPEANLELNGSGSGNVDFCGCLMVSSVALNGHFSFHFDESLNLNHLGRFLVTTWDEVDPSSL